MDLMVEKKSLSRCSITCSSTQHKPLVVSLEEEEEEEKRKNEPPSLSS
jgi:hypothetical protein